jgi:monoamine oxidase
MKRRSLLNWFAAILVERITSKVHGAETQGERPSSAETILVIGAGMAGLAAARMLHDRGFHVQVLEARDRLGGRIWTSTKWPDMPLDLGASWIHGIDGNPLTELADDAHAERLETRYDSSLTYDSDGEELSNEKESRLDRLRKQFYKALRKAQDNDEDQSIREFANAWSREIDADEESKRLLNFILSSEIEQEYSGSAERLSTHWYDSAQAFDGEDALFAKGFAVLVDFLAKDLTIRKDAIVSRIDWHGDKVVVTTNEKEYIADKVIVTLPLGVLKANKIEFVPNLPKPTTDAIAKLEMGTLNKCYLRFSEVFWPDDVDWLEYIPTKHGEWTEWVSFARVVSQPILLGFHAGNRAREIEAWSDPQIVDDAMRTLRIMFGQEIPEPIDYQITRWHSDHFSFGSYSFNSVGSRPNLRRRLATPISGKVFLAGEATDENYFGTVHGAYLSGLRAAKEVMD